MSTLAFWIPLIPLLSAAALAAVSLFSPTTAVGSATSRTSARALAPFLATAPTAIAAVLTFVVLFLHGSGGVSESRVRYTPTGGPELWLGARVDGLAALTAVLVGVVATAVQLYSISYMRHEPRYTSYAALIALFTAAMLVVVYSTDLVVLLVGWEVMGACSYFLIGHYWERHEARAASVKAFLVTKTGDIPFLLGIVLLGRGAGTFRIGPIIQQAVLSGGHGYTLAGAILLIGGVMGKSAQVPLQTWLPDAMAGPTPISALIHAATMVAAGVYVVARLYPVFLVSPASLWILGIAAAVTMVAAALSALAQTDLKRVLAYSTVSQLAMMVGALAVGGRTPAIFHLMSHGGFKALLFLAAGVIIHHVGTGDLAELRSHPLAKKLPVTFVTMTIGLAALAGLPPFSGFFSKESILGAAYETAAGKHESAVLATPPAGLGWLIFAAGLLTAAVTAAYCLRTWFLLFAADGSGRWTRTDRLTVAVPVNPAETDESAEVFSSVAAAEPGEPAEPAAPSILEGLLPEAERPPAPDATRAIRPNKPARVLEAPRGELLPLVVLAALSCVFGFLGLNRGWFAAWLGDADGDRYRAETAEAGRLLQPDLAYHLAPGLVSTVLAVVVLILGFGIVYAAIRSQPADDPARILGPLRTPALHGFFADRAQDTVVVRPVEATAVGVGFLDREVVDGYVRGTGLSARALGGGLRRVQNGNVQLYLTGVLTGVVVIAAVLGFGR